MFFTATLCYVVGVTLSVLQCGMCYVVGVVHCVFHGNVVLCGGSGMCYVVRVIHSVFQGNIVLCSWSGTLCVAAWHDVMWWESNSVCCSMAWCYVLGVVRTVFQGNTVLCGGSGAQCFFMAALCYVVGVAHVMWWEWYTMFFRATLCYVVVVELSVLQRGMVLCGGSQTQCVAAWHSVMCWEWYAVFFRATLCCGGVVCSVFHGSVVLCGGLCVMWQGGIFVKNCGVMGIVFCLTWILSLILFLFCMGRR